MKVAIVGGGYVGKLAAWAVLQAGHSPTIFDRSTDQPFPPRGFVYLHSSCRLPLHQHQVEVISVGGSAEDYGEKVYGDRARPNSFDQLHQEHAWSPVEALDVLKVILPSTQERRFGELSEVLALREEFERVVVTIPAPVLFPDQEWPFVRSLVVVSNDDTPEVRNFCVYNASSDQRWYRAGVMFGREFYEYPEIMGELVPDLPLHSHHFKPVSVMKVIPVEGQLPELERVLFTGRYGSWTKQLGDDAFYDVLFWLESEA